MSMFRKRRIYFMVRLLEREIIIGGIRFLIKSIFVNKTNLYDALRNIVRKKMKNHEARKAG